MTLTAQVVSADLPVLRAAYSDRTAALMATLAHLAYNYPPPGSAPGPSTTVPQPFLDLGFEHITWFHNGLLDGWAFVAEGPTLVVVVFRGTKSATNWKTNFQAEMVHPQNTDLKLRAHKGFLSAYDALSDGSQGIATKFKAVQDRTGGGIPIYFCGHSLGGALAQIAAATLGCDQVAACYTFGSPRVGNSIFDLWVKPPSYRIVNYADIVPQIPICSPFFPFTPYRHSGDVRYLPSDDAASVYRYSPSIIGRTMQGLKGLWQWAFTWRILGIQDHDIKQYEHKLAVIAEARKQAR